MHSIILIRLKKNRIFYNNSLLFHEVSGELHSSRGWFKYQYMLTTHPGVVHVTKYAHNTKVFLC